MTARLFRPTTSLAVLAVLTSALLLHPASTLAQTNDSTYGLKNTAGAAGFTVVDDPATAQTNLNQLIGRIVKTILGLTGVVFLLIIIASGDLWITSGGNEEKIKQAQGMIFHSVVGVAIVFAAYLAADILICIGLEGAGIIEGGAC